MMRYAVFLLFLMLQSCVSTFHYNMSKGIDAFRMKEYRDAFIYLKPEAQRGQPDAQYAIGYMYYYGEGVVENREKARCFIRLAAIAGQKDAVAAVKALQLEDTDKVPLNCVL